MGFEHSNVNAALIATFGYAFPSEKVVFFAEKDHIAFVSQSLSDFSIEIEYHEIDIPIRRSNFFAMIPAFITCTRLFRLAVACDARMIVFSSITSPCLISIKLLTKAFGSVKCVVVPHSILEDVLKRRPSLSRRNLKEWLDELLFGFRRWLAVGNSSRIRYVILGESIRQELARELPRLRKYLFSIDLPYLFQPATDLKPLSRRVIRFGFFGVASVRKGVDTFFRVAEAVKDKKTRYKSEFILIGHFTDEKAKKFTNDAVRVPSPDQPLDSQSYDLYARSIDYAIFLHKSTSYNLVASAALFDSFSYVKPVIALKSSFFEHYFSRMGDIGYLCASYNELEKVILDILEGKTAARYPIQQKNILIHRGQLTPIAQSRKLARLWENTNEGSD